MGRDHFYSPTPNINDNGMLLNTITDVMRQHFASVKSVVAFPETGAVNYHLRTINPTAEVYFEPNNLQMAGINHVLAELAAKPPDAVVLFALPLYMYHEAYFGSDDASGKAILDWVKLNYKQAYIAGTSPFSSTGHAVDIFIRKDLAAVWWPTPPGPGVKAAPSNAKP
jgi:hypothetical protein